MALIPSNVSMTFTLHSDRVDNDNDIILIVNSIPMCRLYAVQIRKLRVFDIWCAIKNNPLIGTPKCTRPRCVVRIQPIVTSDSRLVYSNVLTQRVRLIASHYSAFVRIHDTSTPQSVQRFVARIYFRMIILFMI